MRDAGFIVFKSGERILLSIFLSALSESAAVEDASWSFTLEKDKRRARETLKGNLWRKELETLPELSIVGSGGRIWIQFILGGPRPT